jgi:hypothetical protein
MIKQSISVPRGYSEYVYEFNFPMTVVNKFRIMLFWLISCANMLLNSFRNVENWFSIFVGVEVWLFDFTACAYVGW